VIRARADELSDLITSNAASAKRIRSTKSAARATFHFRGQRGAVRRRSDLLVRFTPHGKKRKVYTLREPLLGVISAITPFNHPLNQVAHKVAPSVATNNAWC
jgi:aldehyde dehydrogenase (NAD+)